MKREGLEKNIETGVWTMKKHKFPWPYLWFLVTLLWGALAVLELTGQHRGYAAGYGLVALLSLIVGVVSVRRDRRRRETFGSDRKV